MKKYLQISVVLAVFGALVFVRQISGNNLPVVMQKNSGQVQSQPQPSNSNSGSVSTQPSTPSSGSYKDGTYTGSVQDAFYGNIQVQATISGGKITNVTFLQYPNDNRTSQYVNSQADPILAQEAIAAQSAQVDIVSGASASSQAFQASLTDALAKAK